MNKKNLIIFLLTIVLVFSSIPFVSFAGESPDGSKDNPFVLEYEESNYQYYPADLETLPGQSEMWFELDSRDTAQFEFSIAFPVKPTAVTGAEVYKDTTNNKIGIMTHEDEYDDLFRFKQNIKSGEVYYFKVLLDKSFTESTFLVLSARPHNDNVDRMVLSKTEYLYDGKAKYPSVTFYDINDNVVPADDFVIKYSNNKKIGYGFVKATSEKYNYVMSTSFAIRPKGTKIKKITRLKKGFKVSWKKQPKNIAGYFVVCSRNADMSDAFYYGVKGKNKTSRTIKGLKSKTKYYVQVCTFTKGLMISKVSAVKKVVTK